MPSLPNADRAVIDPRKLTDYLLARSHPVGRSKARFFESLGFISAEADVLAGALRELAREPDGITTEDTGFGTKYIVDGSLRGPIATARVRSVWIVEHDTNNPRFVTAYPWSLAVVAELETVALTSDVPEHRLVAGDIGTVVHVYSSEDAVEVEFVRADGVTIAVLTLRSAEIRPLKTDMLHARRIAS